MFNSLIPGIEYLCNKNGCQFIWNGFIPAIHYDENISKLDIKEIEDMAYKNQYNEINKLILNKCKNLKID